MSAGQRRRRGATYTLIVIVLSALLVMLGSLFTTPIQHCLELTTTQLCDARAIQAADAGLAWAASALLADPAKGPETRELHLSTGDVKARIEPTGDGTFVVESTGTSRLGSFDAAFTVKARLERVEAPPGRGGGPRVITLEYARSRAVRGQ